MADADDDNAKILSSTSWNAGLLIDDGDDGDTCEKAFEALTPSPTLPSASGVAAVATAAAVVVPTGVAAVSQSYAAKWLVK